MRVIFVHNFYQRRGGEDQCAEQDYELLKKYGFEVLPYFRHNDEIKQYNILKKFSLLMIPTWSPSTFKEISYLIRNFRPDVIHVHNFFPLVSPSVFYAARKSGVPVVLTIHTYRMICSNGLFFRDNKMCELCTKNLLWSIFYGCYRNSRMMTLPVSLMIFVHRKLKTWLSKVELFTTPSEFLRGKIAGIGIPKERIFVRPNFVSGEIEVGGDNREFALFVGRLSQEKGLRILLSAWERLEKSGEFVPLKIVGDGPMREYVIQKAKYLKSVEYVGFTSFPDVIAHMKKALFVILPSVVNETFGRVIIESYAVGTPALGSNLGAIPEIIKDGETGLIFKPNPDDIVSKVKFAVGNKDLLKKWGVNCRKEFDTKYSERVAYENLMKVYKTAIKIRSESRNYSESGE